MLEPAAQAPGMSTDDLKAQLSQGKSLADVASAQGVSKDDVASSNAWTADKRQTSGLLVDSFA
jgi:hypothetical protein